MCCKDYPDVLAETVREPFSDLLDAGCGTGGYWVCSKGIIRVKLYECGFIQKDDTYYGR